jgi:hypothetical protein
MQRILYRAFTFYLIAILAVPLMQAILNDKIIAQDSDSGSLRWDPPVTIKRKEKPRRAPRPKPTRRPTRRPVKAAVEESAPMLTLQYRVMKVREDGTALETNPGAVFFPGDRLRLAVKANQAGYIYIIQQKQNMSQPGMIVFPNSQVNGGQNYVKKDQEFIIPSNCPAGMNPRDCSVLVTPPSGQEFFTLIFSRDLILDLPNQAAQAGGMIMPNIIQELKRASGQILIRKQIPSAGPYTIWVRNTNVEDNEELIETLTLNKGNREELKQSYQP